MNTEKIKELVDSSELPQLQKNVMKGFITRASEERDEECKNKKLIKEVAKERHLSKIILSTDEVKIYTVTTYDEWSSKYPFRSIYFKDGRWRRNSTVTPTLDTAFLSYLEKKHLGSNSQFADFAIKMLSIEIPG